MKYYERMRQLREDNDFSQEFISSLINVGQKTYSDYELGKTRIPAESMLILAKFYNVDMNYLCGITKIKSEYPKE